MKVDPSMVKLIITEPATQVASIYGSNTFMSQFIVTTGQSTIMQ